MTSTRWNPDNIRDVAESVGIATLQKDVVEALAQDVDYRMQQVIVEALKFMRHSRRTTLSTQDIAQALRVLDVEPLYGYESTRPLRFGEASIGPGQPLYYVEDEEVDFEKLINAPLPKVPREISFTAHWLAVEGGPGANPNLAALSGNDNVSVKPLVKHVLSKELQLYFDQVSNAMLDETNDEYRSAALASLRTDPGLHQLVPYFVQFIAEKVTHSLKDLFILTQMMHLTQALLENPSLFVDPYIASVVPPVLTCLVGKRLGSANDSDSTAHFALRDLAGSILIMIAKKYGKSSQTLRSRIARTCLKHFLDPNKPFGTHYGAVIGLQGIAGTEGIRQLIIPNLKVYDGLLKEGLADDARRADAEMVVAALLRALQKVERDTVDMANGYGGGEELRSRLADKVGDVIASRVLEMGRPRLISAVLASDVNI
ncbi:histone H4-like TAF Taf6, SAGA complex subunit [Coniosporium tulheliwenetii]|uniref:Histone H4-like TAF Taf6, SAGA complex subunit n=1 Tax=Coniosporium tulheliwenetii TaxID=3383036 RepID=A0ACC2YWX6_9PEZI|nr:histone H4-like TAF Taf6, SAGA complex subunit [Cladosporium sp. JES 115]